MKRLNQTQLKTLSFLSLIFSLVPFSIYAIWIHVFSLGTTQNERVMLFKEYLPDFLNGTFDATLFSIVFCVLAIILAAISFKLNGKFWKTLNILILGLSGLLLLLNIFSLM